MAEARKIAVVRSESDLLELGRMQVQALRITYDILDRYTGFTAGFWSKKFAACAYSSHGKRGAQRRMSTESFDAMLVALCFDLVAIESPEKIAKLKAWLDKNREKRVGPDSNLTADMFKPIIVRLSRRHMKKLSKMASAARKKIPLWKRQAIARKAGRASAAKRALKRAGALNQFKIGPASRA